MAQRLEPQLKEYGCDMSSHQFQVFVDSMWIEHTDYKTVDEMLVHPTDAIAYCNAVRQQGTEFSSLPEDLILRSLVAYRKAGKGTKR